VSLLTQFIFRLSFGLALAMAITPPRWVTSGYYRVHLYVLLGLNALATLVALNDPQRYPLWPPLAAAIVSYLGSVVWLYEKPRPGIAALVLVAGCDACGAWLSAEPLAGTPTMLRQSLAAADPITAGLVLGAAMAAMLLGHWYLNTPTMQLAPLRRLIVLLAAAAVLRGVQSAAGLSLELAEAGTPDNLRLSLIVLRWLAGLVGVFVLAVLTWQTLKIPNTQSATGILYVAVIVVFLGELTSQRLSVEGFYPV
jgi:hypothetical protein